MARKKKKEHLFSWFMPNVMSVSFTGKEGGMGGGGAQKNLNIVENGRNGEKIGRRKRREE
jgi:hypothetical protein